MKVLQILNHFLPRQVAGTEIYVWALSHGFLQKAVSNKVVIPNYGEYENGSYEVEGIDVIQYAEPTKVDRALKMGFRPAEGLASFKRILQNQNPDIVHFHELAGSNGISIDHVRIAKEMGKKVVFTFHLTRYTCATGNLLYKEKYFCDGRIQVDKCSTCYLHAKSPVVFRFPIYIASKLLNLCKVNTLKGQTKIGTALGTHFLIKKNQTHFNQLVNNCDKLVVVSKWYKDVLLANGVSENQIALIPQALPFFDVKPKFNSTIDSKRKPIKLLFVGRISHFKGLHLLIDALSSFDSSDFELHIYGNRDEAEYEKKLKVKTQEMHQIKWQGPLPHSDTLTIMSQFDIFCLCSTLSEMAPLVIQEAFAANLPVLASNVMGNKSLIEHNVNGLLFDFNNLSSLQYQLKRLLIEKELINKLKSNISLPMMFDSVVNSYVDLYSDLIAID